MPTISPATMRQNTSNLSTSSLSNHTSVSTLSTLRKRLNLVGTATLSRKTKILLWTFLALLLLSIGGAVWYGIRARRRQLRARRLKKRAHARERKEVGQVQEGEDGQELDEMGEAFVRPAETPEEVELRVGRRERYYRYRERKQEESGRGEEEWEVIDLDAGGGNVDVDVRIPPPAKVRQWKMWSVPEEVEGRDGRNLPRAEMGGGE